MTDLETYKQQAAEYALQYVQSGMVLGLGSGSTAKHLLSPLAERLRDGRLHDIVGVPTSEATAGLATFAFGHRVVNAVAAQTLPHLEPSIGVLEKCGFRFEGPGAAEGVIRFVLTREEWQRHQPSRERTVSVLDAI